MLSLHSSFLAQVVLFTVFTSPPNKISFKMFCFQPKRKSVIGTQSTEHKASLFAQQVFWTLAVRPEPLWSGLAELQTTLCSCQQISKALSSDSEVALTHSSFWWTQRSSSGNIHQRSHPRTEADRSGLDRQWQTWLGRAVAADHGRAGEEVTGRAWALPFCMGRHSNVCVHVSINTQTSIYHSQMMSSQMTGAEPALNVVCFQSFDTPYLVLLGPDHIRFVKTLQDNVFMRWQFCFIAYSE